jgi:cytochrome c553
MKARFALIAASLSLVSLPALSQSLGIGGPLQHNPPHAANFHPDANRGRFIALGGEFSQLRVACVSCHGMNGTGDRSGAFPRLTQQSGWYLYSTLRDFADGARISPVMTPIAQELTDGEMQDVAAYYATLAQQPYPPDLKDDKQLIAKGKAIATSGIGKAGVPPCESCHGQKGIGQPPLYPFLAGQYETYLETQLKRFRSGERKGDPMAIMETIASNMNDQQIKAVSAYFASLTPKKLTPGMTLAELHGANRQPPPAQVEPNVGATKKPQPGKGNVVVPSTPSPQQK